MAERELRPLPSTFNFRSAASGTSGPRAAAWQGFLGGYPATTSDSLPLLWGCTARRGALVADHKKDIKEYEKAAKKQDAVGNYAKETLPTLRKHLETAQSWNGTTSTANPPPKSPAVIAVPAPAAGVPAPAPETRGATRCVSRARDSSRVRFVDHLQRGRLRPFSPESSIDRASGPFCP